MGILYIHLHLFREQFEPGKIKSLRVLTLGNQDTYFTYDQAVRYFTLNGIPFVKVPEARRRTADSHATVPNRNWGNFSGFLHQKTLFEMMGFDPSLVQSIDVDPYENADLLHDFNLPLPGHLVGKFDLLVDFGTIEHIFDVRQNFENITKVLALNGRVLHFCPANIINHGFFNVSKDLLRDAYLPNGFEEETLQYVSSSVKMPDRYRLISADEMSESSAGSDYLALAGVYRKTIDTPFRVPKQGLYRQLHAAWREGLSRPLDAKSFRDETPSIYTRMTQLVRLRKAPGRTVRFLRPE